MEFIKRRIITYIIVFLITVNLDFIIPRLAPGGPAVLLAEGSRFPSGAIQVITLRLGLNQPLSTQYFLFLKNLFEIPPYFGVSYAYYPIPVFDLFVHDIPWDFVLIGSSFLLAYTISYSMASAGSLRRRGKIESSSLYASVISQAVPSYWIGMVILWVFAVDLKWFPLFGNGDIGNQPSILSIAYHLVLPITAMTIAIFGEMYMIMRGSIQEISKSDYVFAAKCRGLKDSVLQHAYILRNALLPYVSSTSFSFAKYVGIAILVETVFGYPGVGGAIVDALYTRDYPVLSGFFVLLSLIVILAGFIGDIVLIYLDPRLRR
jgi:peptide/nickel transport system permease protein